MKMVNNTDNYPRDEHGVILGEVYAVYAGTKQKFPVHADGLVWTPDGKSQNIQTLKPMTFDALVRRFTEEHPDFKIEDYAHENENEEMEESPLAVAFNTPEQQPQQPVQETPKPDPIHVPAPSANPSPAAVAAPQNPQKPIPLPDNQFDSGTFASNGNQYSMGVPQSFDSVFEMGKGNTDTERGGMDTNNAAPYSNNKAVQGNSQYAENQNAKVNEDENDKVVEQKGKQKPKPQKAKREKNVLQFAAIPILVLLVLMVAMQGYSIYRNIMSEPETLETLKTVEYDPNGTSLTENERVIIKVTKDLKSGDVIKEEDIKGIIVSLDKYKLLSAATYISEDGTEKNVEVIPWGDRASVINKFANQDLTAGSYLTNLNVTSQKVVKDKYFVEVEYEGKTKVVQVNADGTGNTGTRVELVAIITKDGGEPYSTTLAEMYLKDRELENLFDHAGVDILESLTSDTVATGQESTPNG